MLFVDDADCCVAFIPGGADGLWWEAKGEEGWFGC